MRAAGGDHRLRRDAVPQVRGTADDVALDHRRPRRRGGRRGGGDVAGGSAADDHESSGHQRSPDDHAVVGEEACRCPPRCSVLSASGTGVRAEARRVRQQVTAFADVLEVHAVGRQEVPTPGEAVLAEDLHRRASTRQVAKSGGAHPWQEPDGVGVERHRPRVPRQESERAVGRQTIEPGEVAPAVGVGVRRRRSCRRVRQQRPPPAPPGAPVRRRCGSGR